MPGQQDLRNWLRNPANVTGKQLLAEAMRRGWQVRRQKGDHVILSRAGVNLVIDLGTKANGTKRQIIMTMMEADDE